MTDKLCPFRKLNSERLPLQCRDKSVPMLEQLHTTPRRYVAECRYNYTILGLGTMEASVQLNATAALAPVI
jgi:hypothetical protein